MRSGTRSGRPEGSVMADRSECLAQPLPGTEKCGLVVGVAVELVDGEMGRRRGQRSASHHGRRTHSARNWTAGSLRIALITG
jgi:hypothetical protein